MSTLICFILIVYLSFNNNALYNSWKYGDIYNYGTLPITQKLGYEFSPNMKLATETFPGSIHGSLFLMTSNNSILAMGFDENIITLYKYDKCLFLQFKSPIVTGVRSLFSVTNDKGPYAIYQEYNNRKYLAQLFVYMNTESEWVYSLMVFEINDNDATILWKFNYNGNDRYSLYYQHIIYKNYVFFQHATETGNCYSGACYINRYVFDLNDGSVLWESLNVNRTMYGYYGPPMIFENNYGNIFIIFDNNDYFHAINMKTGHIIWEHTNSYFFIGINGIEYGSIYQKYGLLFRACKIDIWYAAICVFDIINGNLITVEIQQKEIGSSFRMAQLNIGNGQNDFIVATENDVIYYDININNSTNPVDITFTQTKNISAYIGKFYYIDSDSNILFSIDYYDGNDCGQRMGNPRKLSREYFILNKSGTISNSVCTGFYGHSPIIPNIQTMEEQYIYFVSQRKVIAFASEISQSDINITDSLTNSTLNESCIDSTDINWRSDAFDSDILRILIIISGTSVGFLCCILCCFMNRQKLYELAKQCSERNNRNMNNQMQQQRENNEFDYYPKKPKSRQHNRNEMKENVGRTIGNIGTTKQNMDDMMKSKNNDKHESIEMIGKQPTLSYSAMNCVICLDILLENESSKLICGHKFHTHCIEEYNETNKECPLCRKTIVFD